MVSLPMFTLFGVTVAVGMVGSVVHSPAVVFTLGLAKLLTAKASIKLSPAKQITLRPSLLVLCARLDRINLLDFLDLHLRLLLGFVIESPLSYVVQFNKILISRGQDRPYPSIVAQIGEKVKREILLCLKLQLKCRDFTPDAFFGLISLFLVIYGIINE